MQPSFYSAFKSPALRNMKRTVIVRRDFKITPIKAPSDMRSRHHSPVTEMAGDDEADTPMLC